MDIKIKEFQGRAVTTGFFPKAGVKIRPGEIYTCESEEMLDECLDTGLVEMVRSAPKKPGRPKKVDVEDDQSGE